MVEHPDRVAYERGELMEGKIKAIVKRPDEEFGHMTNISCTLKNLQNIVGGYIETVTVADNLVIICNEEGLIRDLPFNCELCGHMFFGTLIFIGADGEDFADVPITFKEYKQFFFGG